MSEIYDILDTEPDKLDGEHCGYKTALRRGPLGHWCGYVGIDSKHPFFGKSYNSKVSVPESIINRDINVDKIGAMNLLCLSIKGEELNNESLEMYACFDVHGGLTFSDTKIVDSNEKNLWWLGFDCAHAGDLCPGNRFIFEHQKYRDIEYVKKECESLAEQLFNLR